MQDLWNLYCLLSVLSVSATHFALGFTAIERPLYKNQELLQLKMLQYLEEYLIELYSQIVLEISS
jgi:hypothetical protein